MVARRKREKTSGPPSESSSKGKSIEDDDVDYNPDEDLDSSVTKAKRRKVSRPKFVSKPSRVLVQEGVSILNTIFSQATTTTHVPVSVATPLGPASTSTQVTPDTQRLLDELISTPPVGSSSSPTVTILFLLLLCLLHNKDVLVVSLEHLVGNVLKVNDAHQALIVTQRSQLLVHQLQIESLNASLEKVLKQLAAQGESSCRQETVIVTDVTWSKPVVLEVTENEDDDPEGAHGGDEQPIASSMPSVSLVGDSTVQGESGGDGDKGEDKQVNDNIESEILECLIDLDNVLIDDWESDAEGVEIEFEQDDEVVKYATHEGAV
ncbi:hypothetical protein L1987_20185 [Smallanthus sonchifolius]|uniref:Uncharacterized protein n=1 Tax=Smallanthus sonchifolius TaxID=185202 RepID=A0ACB9IST8_9ASTR|nr:hypothetical protein L1987_20185 [Smallanthus sonchifolius]